MIFSGSTKINDVRSGSATVCGALQTASQALFWGFGNTTVSRVLSGSIALYKFGPGVVTLSGANTYSNGTFLYEGTLTLNNSSAIGTSGNITFAGGGLRFLSGITRDISSRIKNSSSAVDLTVDAGTQTWISNIDSSNIAGLTKRGLGQITFTAANEITGPLTITEGRVYFQQPSLFSSVNLLVGVGNGTGLAGTNNPNGLGTGTINFALRGGPAFSDYVSWDSSGVTTGPLVVTNNVVADMTKGRASLNFFGNKGAEMLGSINLIGTGAQSSATTTTTTTNSNQLVLNNVTSQFIVGNIIGGTNVPNNSEILAISGLTITLSKSMSVASGTLISAGSGDFVITNSQTGNSTLTVSSQISSATYQGSFSLRGGNVGSNGIFTGSLNSTNAGLTHNGVNWWTIFSNQANNYGRLSVQNAASNSGFILGNDNATVPQALWVWGSLSASSIDTNGKNATCSGLSGTIGSVNLVNKLTNSSQTPSTLTLANMLFTRSFFGTISGNINLVLNSPARLQQLYGSNNHTGTNQVIAGTLAVQSTAGGALSKLTLAALQSSSISATFSSTPTSTEVFKLFNGSTVNTYPSVSLTGAPGLTGYYNSSTSTVGFVPAATSVTTGLVTAQINALTIPVSANPNGSQAGSAASVSVEYGSTPSLGLTSTPVNIGTGTVSILSTHQLSGLTANTLYYYRAKVSNVLWTVNSSTASISTLGGDPFWANTIFMQNFDSSTVGQPFNNANLSSNFPGSTVFSSNNTIVSSPSLSGNSMRANVTFHDYVLLSNSYNLGSSNDGPFTWEFSVFGNNWVYDPDNVKYHEFWVSGEGGYVAVISFNGSFASPSFYLATKQTATTGGLTLNTTVPVASANGWYDFAITRDSSYMVRFFINGQLVYSAQSSSINGPIKWDGVAMRFVGVTANQYFVDDVRWSNVCRYTSNYTPLHPFLTP